jgi:hypothetical protein
MKASGQLQGDLPAFAAFDAGCSLEMAFGMEGEWKKCKDGDKDYPGQREMPHMRRIHRFTRNRMVG